MDIRKEAGSCDVAWATCVAFVKERSKIPTFNAVAFLSQKTWSSDRAHRERSQSPGAAKRKHSVDSLRAKSGTMRATPLTGIELAPCYGAFLQGGRPGLLRNVPLKDGTSAVFPGMQTRPAFWQRLTGGLRRR